LFRCVSGLAGTPLSCILQETQELPQCTAILLDAGADPTIPLRSPGDKYTTFAGFHTPLSTALANTIKNLWLFDHCAHGSRPFRTILKRMIYWSLTDLTEAACGTQHHSSTWLSAFLVGRSVPPTVAECLLDAGCDINEKALNLPNVPDGWNCLFVQVLRARNPEYSHEFETLRFLLRQRADVFTKDATGLTIFDYVSLPQNAGYKRDLWYCALRREGIETGSNIEVHFCSAKHSTSYTLEHYYAMCHLDTWTNVDLSRQVQESLRAYPETKEVTAELCRIRVKKERMTRDFDGKWQRQRTRRRGGGLLLIRSNRRA